MRSRFAAARVARLATVDQTGAPHLVPMVFALAGDVIHSAVDAKPKSSRNLKRMRNIQAEPRVAVLADHYETDWTRLSQYYTANVNFFDDLGSPGGAAKMGEIDHDHPFIAALPPQNQDD